MLAWSDLKVLITLTSDSVECPVNGCQKTVPRQRKRFNPPLAFSTRMLRGGFPAVR